MEYLILLTPAILALAIRIERCYRLRRKIISIWSSLMIFNSINNDSINGMGNFFSIYFLYYHTKSFKKRWETKCNVTSLFKMVLSINKKIIPESFCNDQLVIDYYYKIY